MLQKYDFSNIFGRGLYKKCRIDVKYGMDTLEYTDYVYAKFQASTTSENLSVLTQKCDFSTKITEKGHFSHLTRSKGLLELSNLAQKTSSSSSITAQNFMLTAKEVRAKEMLQNAAKI